MSNIIPPLVSDSPPPPPSEDDDDEEFDEFRESNDISYACDSFSLTPSPEPSPKKLSPEVVSSTVKQENDFKFKSVNPDPYQETKENISGEIKEKSDANNHKVDTVHNKTSKPINSELSSESLEEIDVAITTNVFHKNNFITQDNIPSQFIIETQNVKDENELKNCDINEKLEEDLLEPYIEGKKLDVTRTDLTNGSVQSHSSNDFNNGEISRTFSISTIQIDAELKNSKRKDQDDSQLSVLKYFNITNVKNIEGSDEFSNFSTDVPKVLKEIELLESDTKLDAAHNNDNKKIEEFNKITDPFLSYPTHSTSNISRDLVKDENIASLNGNFNTFGNSSDELYTITETSLNNFNEKSNDDFETFRIQSIDANRSRDFVDISKTTVLNKGEDNENYVFDNFSPFPTSFTSNQNENFQASKDINNFSNFSTVVADNSKNNDKNSGDFANFASFPVSNPVENDEFDDFTAFPIDSIETEVGSVHQNVCDDDFDDFGEFTSTTFQPSSSSSSAGTIQKTECPVPILLLNEKEAFKKTKEIIKDIFASSDEDFEDFQYFELGKGDNIFTQLQDVTDTPALAYHWSKSASQKLLLKALNIDSRNILYGHSWNSSVPRFAANLSVQPLEPIKMEPLTPTPVEPVLSTAQNSQSETVEVPSAQFDWTSSGLVNPLDYSQTTLLDLEQLVASLDIHNTNPTTSSSMKVEEDWDIWLKYSPSESTAQPAKSEPMHNPQADNDDFEEFTSFQSSQPHVGWPNVPLRETYISDVPQAHIDVDVVLQPTIVTPELPRKDLSTEDVTGLGETLHDDKSDNIKLNEDEEFDDFQVVYPESNISTIKENENVSNNNIIEEIKQDTFAVTYLEVTKPEKNIEPKEIAIEAEDEDDFTEFHSSVPLPQPPAPSVLLPILQPTPAYTTSNSNQINWPDPGITQDEIKRFEEVFSVPLAQKKEQKTDVELQVSQPTDSDRENKQSHRSSSISIWDSLPINNRYKKPEIKEHPKKVESKQNSFEDDEWSDFVSVQKPSPIHKMKLTDRTQTPSPDLPLSVLNLGSIQPTKQPIPVITPQGLVQTKLSTNMNPIAQPKPLNVKSSYDLPPLQPSIISHQYISQAYNFGTPPQSSQIVQNGQDDDEWGEFVSSPLPPQYQNSSTTLGHQWGTFAPNIRSCHEQGVSQTSNSNKSTGSNLQRKSKNLSGLVLPELDFLALKERTGVPRKK